MTITPSMMYWFTRLDGITTLFAVITFCGAFALLFLIAGYYAKNDGKSTDDENDYRLFSSVLKWFVPIWVVALLGLLFVPNSKQMAMIYVVPALTESQVVKQDIPELYDLGVNALKDWLKQTKGGDND